MGTYTPARLARVRGEIQELIKFVALNYLAVVKAIKKRNRHFKVCCCPASLLLGLALLTLPICSKLHTHIYMYVGVGVWVNHRSNWSSDIIVHSVCRACVVSAPTHTWFLLLC